jgi:hypothetical protein
MTDQPLSPAAQAVLDASNLHPCKDSCLILAATLQAAARLNPGPFVPELFGEGWNAAMGELRNIAAEMEAQ